MDFNIAANFMKMVTQMDTHLFKIFNTKGVKDIEDIYKDEFNALKDGFLNNQHVRSIKGKSESYILQYPLVISETISPETVDLIRNQIEIERATEMHMVMSNTPSFTYTGDSNILSHYHTNIRLEDADLRDEGITSVRDIINKSEELTDIEEERLNYKSINESTIPRDYLLAMHEKKTKILKEKDDEALSTIPEITRQNFLDGTATIKPINAKTSVADVAKRNKMTPLILTTEIRYEVYPKDPKTGKILTDKKPEYFNQKIVFGIKSIVHLVKANDVVFYLSDSTKYMSLLTKMIKWTTGEIKLVRDIILRTDRSKRTAVTMRKNNKVWERLTTLGDSENVRKYLANFHGSKNIQVIPTTTLVISIDEVTKIQSDTGINLLTDKRHSEEVYRSLFLLDMLIVDEVNDIVYKYEPSNKVFERLSLSYYKSSTLSDSKKASENSLEKIAKMFKKV